MHSRSFTYLEAFAGVYLLVSPFQACCRKCCKSLTHDRILKIQRQRCCFQWWRGGDSVKVSTAVLSSNTQQAVCVSAPGSDFIAAECTMTESWPITPHWEEGKGKGRQAERQRKLSQRIAVTEHTCYHLIQTLLWSFLSSQSDIWIAQESPYWRALVWLQITLRE